MGLHVILLAKIRLNCERKNKIRGLMIQDFIENDKFFEVLWSKPGFCGPMFKEVVKFKRWTSLDQEKHGQNPTLLLLKP
jgi:hypothetical protein